MEGKIVPILLVSLSRLFMEPDDAETKRHGIKARLKAWKQGGEYGWVTR
jgi:hypothetical protein